MSDQQAERCDFPAGDCVQADAELYARWRAAVLAHERMCREVDLYTPRDVYAAYLAAREDEIEAALALRAAVAPLGLGVSGWRRTEAD